MTCQFDDELSDTKSRDHKKECTGSLCHLLKELSTLNHTNGTQPLLLITHKGTSHPLSLDGSYTPTQFTLETFDSKTCCAVFSFEDLLDTSPLKTVRRSFVENCHEIAGIAILEDDGSESFN